MSYSEQTYGEIIDIQKLYSIIKTHIPDTCKYYFYDFGSGFGKIVENIGSKFQLSYGIEITLSHISSALVKSPTL